MEEVNVAYQENIADLKSMNIAELEMVASRIRERIVKVVSQNGGHLSSTLGAVDLIVAMHYVFDTKTYPFIFDVSHQAYAHKLLSGRWNEFETLRSFGGISGFCNPKESASDYFIAGHSSTSISLGVGVAKAFALQKRDAMPIVLIGDGSMSAGLVYEALNELGDKKYPMIIILNDNEMSISSPIGAISNYLSQALSTPMYQKTRDKIKKILQKMPDSANYLARKFEESIKLIAPGLLFEELGLDYIGPIDGHHLELIIMTLQKAKEMKKPIIIHAQTTKGKGYEIAEGRFEKWHGVGPFDIDTGMPLKKSISRSPTSVFSDALKTCALKDEKIVGVTAAMPSGTGLDKLIQSYPNRFWDVAICEAHAVTSMAAMAKEGFKPFVAIYSTFLQRAYDQIVHDVGILGVPVRFAIDRAGIVGEDGETHQGLLDIAYLRPIPNMVLFAPRDNENLIKAVEFASRYDLSPCAFRYPRNQFILSDNIFQAEDFVLGKAEILAKGENLLLIGYGNGVGRAYQTFLALQEKGYSPTLLDLRFLKPLDEQLLCDLFLAHRFAFVFSDSYCMGGVGSALLEFLSLKQISSCQLHSFEIPDQYITHGNTAIVEQSLGLQTTNFVQEILKRISL